jgi:hypothetical protein
MIEIEFIPSTKMMPVSSILRNELKNGEMHAINKVLYALISMLHAGYM